RSARFGKISDTSIPFCPYLLNWNGLGISGPGQPWRTLMSPLPVSGCPAYLVRAGLGSNVSTWLGPPVMNSEITAFARALKCGGLGAYGFPWSGVLVQLASIDSAASSPSLWSREASASPLIPPPD